MTPRIVFAQELSQLQDHVEEMGQYIEETYRKLFRAVKEKDQNRLQKILRKDRTISSMQHKIEASCLSLITRQQPIASDLRTVTAALKVVTDMERAGNHCADIAELSLRLNMKEWDLFSTHLLSMINETGKMMKEAVDSFVGRDLDAAKKVIEADDIVDNLFNRVKEDLIEALKSNSLDADECVDVLMVAKYLEKIGDHAVNIGQWEIFKETGNMEDERLL